MAENGKQVISPYNWRFFRAGGFDQALIDSGRDLMALETLDQKLWVALSCPVKGIEFDQRTLELIDTDHDGHVRVPEILGAISWAALRLKDPDLLVRGEDNVPLDAINEATPEGEQLLASARTILVSLGKGEADRVSVEDTSDMEQVFAKTLFNGDGVVTAAAAEDNEDLGAWIATLVECLGGVGDRSGEAGISADTVQQFDNDARAWLAWQEEGAADETLRTLGAQLEDAVGVWNEVKAKMEDYFLRCRLAAYDDRAAALLGSTEEGLQALAVRNLSEAGEEIGNLPLSAVRPEQVLNLEQGLNPVWESRIERFRDLIVRPFLGDAAYLDSSNWENLQARLASAEDWWGKRIETPVAALGSDRLRAWVAGDVTAALMVLVDKDLALKAEFDAMIEVETLARYCRDLYCLINNFVSFRTFYTRSGPATFQAGTLYLDGRSCELCLAVNDTGKHAALASLSRVYLVYCDCVRNGGEDKMTVAVAVTNGDSDQLIVGRNGVFYDRAGQDWDATIVRIVEHPISIRQAFWAPYKRIGRMIGDQIQKMAAARSKAAEEKSAAHLMQVGQKKEEAKPAQQQMFDVGKFAGIFAAIGLAVGAIGTALVSMVTGFFHLKWWQMPLAIAGIMLVISGPSIIIAWFKLRQRNLGPLLDANGWAINARAKLNIPFGASLTGMPRLPEGSKSILNDPYAEKKSPWKSWFLLVILVVLALVAWRFGWICRGCHWP